MGSDSNLLNAIQRYYTHSPTLVMDMATIDLAIRDFTAEMKPYQRALLQTNYFPAVHLLPLLQLPDTVAIGIQHEESRESFKARMLALSKQESSDLFAFPEYKGVIPFELVNERAIYDEASPILRSTSSMLNVPRDLDNKTIITFQHFPDAFRNGYQYSSTSLTNEELLQGYTLFAHTGFGQVALYLQIPNELTNDTFQKVLAEELRVSKELNRKKIPTRAIAFSHIPIDRQLDFEKIHTLQTSHFSGEPPLIYFPIPTDSITNNTYLLTPQTNSLESITTEASRTISIDSRHLTSSPRFAKEDFHKIPLLVWDGADIYSHHPYKQP